MEFVQFEGAEEMLHAFLKERGIGTTVRILATGIGCMGPTFALVAGECTSMDIAIPFYEYILVADKADIEKYGGYLFKATRMGIRIKSKKKIEGDCSTCWNARNTGGCH